MKAAIALAGALLVAAGGVVASTLPGHAAHDDVPALIVSRDSFVRRVTADGTLRAVEGKQIFTPTNDWARPSSRGSPRMASRSRPAT